MHVLHEIQLLDGWIKMVATLFLLVTDNHCTDMSLGITIQLCISMYNQLQIASYTHGYVTTFIISILRISMRNYACVVPSYDASQDWEFTGAEAVLHFYLRGNLIHVIPKIELSSLQVAKSQLPALHIHYLQCVATQLSITIIHIAIHCIIIQYHWLSRQLQEIEQLSYVWCIQVAYSCIASYTLATPQLCIIFF